MGSIFKAQNVPHGDLEPELPCTMNAASRQLYTAAQDFTVARDAAMASADAACLLTLLGFEGYGSFGGCALRSFVLSSHCLEIACVNLTRQNGCCTTRLKLKPFSFPEDSNL